MNEMCSCCGLTLDEVYPIAEPYLRTMRDTNRTLQDRRNAARWLIEQGLDQVEPFTDTGKEIRAASMLRDSHQMP